LFPAGVIVPESGTPPSMRNFSKEIDLAAMGCGRSSGRLAAGLRGFTGGAGGAVGAGA
jgi:hypothetical protein